jgi:hypothetical protein
MVNDPTLSALLPGGVHQTTSIDRTPTQKPFIIYRVIAHRPDHRGDDQDILRSENFLVFVHDVPGDYLKIDNILRQLKLLYINAKDVNAGVGCVSWLEDSEDFRDEDMGTIMKYGRYSIRYIPSEVVL